MGILIILALTLFVLFLVGKAFKEQDEKETKKRIAVERHRSRGREADFSVNGAGGDSVLIYERENKVYINGKEFRFSDVIDVKLNNDTYNTISNPLFKTTTTKKADGITNIVYITVNSISEPIVKFSTINDNTAQRVMSALKVIISRNK